jgi:catechol 2,3-dioxygenase-like lactoylglutathione lyase family enzyme
MDFKLELVPIPVADVDRALNFYADKCGFHVDHDLSFGEQRIIQLTPTGSACSIMVGKGVGDGVPGTIRALHLVVADVHAARAELIARGVEVEDVVEMKAEGKPTVSYAAFSDPDGNTWTLQAW